MRELSVLAGWAGVDSGVLAQAASLEDGISPHLTGLVAVLCLFGGPMLVAIAWIVANAWCKASTHASDTELKHRLLDAGMTADEIERVINAGRAAAESEPGHPGAEAAVPAAVRPA